MHTVVSRSWIWGARKKALRGLKVEIVGLKVTTVSMRTGTHLESWRRVPGLGAPWWNCTAAVECDTGVYAESQRGVKRSDFRPSEAVVPRSDCWDERAARYGHCACQPHVPAAGGIRLHRAHQRLGLSARQVSVVVTLTARSVKFNCQPALVVFSALTLLVARHEDHPACKNWVVGCWCGYLSGAIVCILFAYGPADATATLYPIVSCLI